MKTVNPRKDLAQYTFLSKYARFLPEKQRRETYEEANHRTIEMHRRKYDGVEGIGKVLDTLEQALNDKRIIGSQRSLQFAGHAIERINARIYNCSASFFDRPRFLAEAVWLGLCGCGVGFSVQKHHVAKLPKLTMRINNAHLIETHLVHDSIEGWANAFDNLFDSYINDRLVRFDYSLIRVEGSTLSTSSAKAPGAKPLRDSLEACRKLLDRVVAEQGGVLRPIDAYDLVMHAVMCVRAGGIRRSATIAIFSPDDVEMAQAKTGNWFTENPQRRLSNNSALLVRSEVKRHQFDALMTSTKSFGEPGFYFANSTEECPNPCVEIGMDPVDHTTGETGWSFCNTTSINVAEAESEAEFLDACVLASWLGTLQAGYTDVGYLTTATKRILERDALLGVSLTGMADNPDIAFNYGLLKAGADFVRAANFNLSNTLGITPAARLTTVKPEGTGSLVLGVGNGIHPHHSRRYLRHVEGGKRSDPLVQFFLKHLPEAVVTSAYNADEVKLVFPIDLGDGPLWLKADTVAVDHLARVKAVQESWVKPGTVRDALAHNVSNTVVVRETEWSEVADYIWAGRESFGGVSLLGSFGDLDYEQAPFVEVLTADEIEAKYGDDPLRYAKACLAWVTYEGLARVWVNLPWDELVETEDLSGGTEVVACAGGACLV